MEEDTRMEGSGRVVVHLVGENVGANFVVRHTFASRTGLNVFSLVFL
jgi:hypothetical protein